MHGFGQELGRLLRNVPFGTATQSGPGGPSVFAGHEPGHNPAMLEPERVTSDVARAMDKPPSSTLPPGLESG